MTTSEPVISTTSVAEPKTPDRNALLEKCGALAAKDSILHELEQSLKKHGFVGPTDIPKIIFLAAITRVFARPVSGVIKGQSASGKSFALRAALRYIPKSVYQEFQGLSDKALVYSTDLKLEHGLLVIGEAAGLAEGHPGTTHCGVSLNQGLS